MKACKLPAQRSQEIVINRLKKDLSDTYCFSDIPVIKPSTPRKNKHQNNPTEFEGIINDPILCSELRKYLEEQNAIESLNFWKAVQQFKVDAKPNEFRDNANKLFKKYFRSRETLPIPPEMIQNVKNILEDPEEDINISIFNEIQKEVYTFLKRRYFKSFLSSQFYEEGMEIRKKVGDVRPSHGTGLTERDWHLILAGANEMTVEEDTPILFHAQHNHFLYRLKEGSLNIIKPIAGKDTVIATLTEPGCVVGEMSILGNSAKATATVVATPKTKVFKIQVQFMYQLFETDVDLARRFYVSFGKKLATLLDGIASFNQVDRVGHEIPENNAPVKKDQAEKRFQILFKLPNDEVLVKKFPAVLEQIFTKKGMLYISQNYICFYAIIFKQKMREILPLKQVSAMVQKLTSKGKEIVVSIGKKKYKFYFSNEEGETVFNILQDLVAIRTDKDTSAVQHSSNNRKRSHNKEDDDDIPEEILSNEEWDILLNGNSSWNSIIRFSPGDIIFQEGLKHSIICQITSGTVRIEKLVPGDKNLAVVLDSMGPGEVFGEIQFLTDSVASASVIAQDYVDMYIIDGDFIKTTLFSANPSLVINFYRYLCMILSKRIIKRESEGWGRKRSE